MKILHLTDIHGDSNKFQSIAKWLESAGLVILSGDITHFGNKSDTEQIIVEIEKFTNAILSVTGNCDYPDVQSLLEQRGYFTGTEIRRFENHQFLGLSGSLPCPGSTPNEYSDDQFNETINQLKSKLSSKYPVILISHQPPYKTKNDKIAFGLHVGSKSIRRFIENEQPLACFTGHIHEGKAVDEIGKTKIINPGPFKNGRFAWITIENNVLNAELKKI